MTDETNPFAIVEPVVEAAIAGIERIERVSIERHAVNVVILPVSKRHKAIRMPHDDREFRIMRTDGRIQKRAAVSAVHGCACIHFRRSGASVHDVTVTTFC